MASIVLLLLATFLGRPAIVASRATADDTAPRRPNLVVILADDLGYGDLSSYGANDLRSPHIDALVAAGMRFENAYANCPVCSPTRAALLSGRYPELVGVPGVIRTHAENNWGYLAPQATLLPSALKKGGYHTAIVGKWHLGLREENHPCRRGFDHFHGFLGDMMDDYYAHTRHGNHYMRRDMQEIRPEGHATDLFTDWAVQYIEGRAKEEQPFFLYLAYNAPHTPIQPPQEWLQKVRARQPGISKQRAALVALIEQMDDGIGRVVAALRESGAWDETLLIFTSDNGGQANVGADNGPWRGEKQEMYEGGLRVPQCVVWPGRVAAGSSTDVVTLSMDLYPTLCAAAGAEAPPALDGRSLLPLLRGEPLDFQRNLYWTRREGGTRYMGQAVWAARKGDWKLLQNSPTGPFELFNLKEDPYEQHDLARQRKAEFNELATLLRRQMQRGGAVPWQAPQP